MEIVQSTFKYSDTSKNVLMLVTQDGRIHFKCRQLAMILGYTCFDLTDWKLFVDVEGKNIK